MSERVDISGPSRAGPVPRSLAGRRVLVTGGAGFLGSRVVSVLEARGATVAAPRRAAFDLTRREAAEACMREHRPELVVHAAAYYGGIEMNRLHPGRIFFENVLMGAHVLDAARLAGAEKVVVVGTACAYPGHLEGDLTEDRLWDGPCHESVANYGVAKKALAVQAWAYRREYGLDSAHVILTNLYGPGDTFQLERAHVASALIRKFVEAKRSGAAEVEVWGSGRPIRELLYVDDAAEAIVRAAERVGDGQVLNVGTGVGTSIRDLAEAIRARVGGDAAIRWCPERPDGALRKVLDVTRMKRLLDWEPPTALGEGLDRTIAWYEANKVAADARA